MCKTIDEKTAPPLLVLLTVACASHVRISQLLADPGYYDGKTVVTTGSVAGSAGVLNYATFQLRNSGGTITVVTQSSGAPRDSTRVEVKGNSTPRLRSGRRAWRSWKRARGDPSGHNAGPPSKDLRDREPGDVTNRGRTNGFSGAEM